MEKQKQVKEDPRLISYNALRKAIGWMGLLLPFVLWFGLWVIFNCSLQPSISQYYYTRMGNVLTGTLCAVALFLFAYKGYPDSKDGVLCNIAAAFALGVALIPMEFHPPKDVCYVRYSGDEWFRILHYIFASAFFIMLAIISLKYFIKTKGKYTRGKHKRNKLYRTCGRIIIASIVCMVPNFFPAAQPFYEEYKLLFVFETIALLAFGVSWLVKGDAVFILTDKHKENGEEMILPAEN